MLGGAGCNLLFRLRVGVKRENVTSLSAFEATALLDHLLVFSRVLRNTARATSSISLYVTVTVSSVTSRDSHGVTLKSLPW